jgi:uncharacterized protein YjcR
MKRRGAQPGNTNALQHGFYAANFKPEENDQLGAVPENSLLDEIKLLRVAIRRLFGLASSKETLEEWTIAIEAIGVASVRLAGLLKAHKLISGSQSNLSDALSVALSEVCNELPQGGK